MIDDASLRLIAITDNLRDGIAGLAARARAACRGGATMIHLRLPDESARTLADAARAILGLVTVPLVIHQRVDVALAAGAAGVHLGVHDMSVSDVRRLTGNGFIVGRSACDENDLGRACAADYITLGPVFRAADKLREEALGLSEFERLTKQCQIPVVAIGGISSTTACEALRAGARGVALISAIFGSSDPELATREVRAAIGR